MVGAVQVAVGAAASLTLRWRPTAYIYSVTRNSQLGGRRGPKIEIVIDTVLATQKIFSGIQLRMCQDTRSVCHNLCVASYDVAALAREAFGEAFVVAFGCTRSGVVNS